MKRIQHPNEQGFSAITLLLMVVLISGIALVGYYVGTQMKTPDSTIEKNQSTQTTAINEGNDIDTGGGEISWAEYTNTELGIDILYPESWGEIEVENQEKNRDGCCSYLGEWYVISFDSSSNSPDSGAFTRGYIATLDFEYTAPGVGGHLFYFPGGDFPMESFDDFLKKNKEYAFPSYELLHSESNYVVNGSILRDSILGHGVMILADINLGEQRILRVGYFHKLSADELALEEGGDDITSVLEVLPEQKYNEFIEFAKINS